MLDAGPFGTAMMLVFALVFSGAFLYCAWNGVIPVRNDEPIVRAETPLSFHLWLSALGAAAIFAWLAFIAAFCRLLKIA